MNPAVAAWLVLSAFGLIVSLFLTRESVLDLIALGPRMNGRRKIATSRALREGLRVTVHIGWLAAGLVAADILPGPRGIIVPVLLYGNLVLVVNSIIDTRTRHLLYERREGPDSPRPMR